MLTVELCSFLAPPQASDEIGRLGPYRVLKVLGQGGMGVVFLAEDPQLKRQIALKAMLPGVAADTESRKRFFREAQATAAIENDHVIPIYQVAEDRGVPYFAMPLLKGQPLNRWLKAGRSTNVHQVLRIGRQIAQGLAAAHQRGLIHRDIKPANIWLEAPSGRVRILDFGLARADKSNERLTQSGTVTGTPAYMAPEQARAAETDARSDLFSLGCVLYELCTGQLPFGGDSTVAILIALTLDAPRPIEEVNPKIPPALAALVMQMLAKDPSQRPASALQVDAKLEAIETTLKCGEGFVTQLPVPSVRPSRRSSLDRTEIDFPAVPPRKRRPSRRRYVLLGAFAVTACLVLGALGLGARAMLSRTVAAPPREAPPPIPAPMDRPPVRVFLLAGDSNMAGRGAIRTLEWLGQDAKHADMLKKLKNADGSWARRSDVWIFDRQVDGPGKFRDRKGNLTVGYGEKPDEIGPELLFGQGMAEAGGGPVLLIKVTKGPISLHRECRPPSAGGEIGAFYKAMIDSTREILADLPKHFPTYDGRACVLSGLVWFHGWVDMVGPGSPEDKALAYEQNLVHLIRDVRKDLKSPELPVVIGELGVGGATPDASISAFRKAQAAAANRPEFAGKVTLAATSACWDTEAAALLKQGWERNRWTNDEAKQKFDRMASQPEYLYMGSAKVMALIGAGFAEAMKRSSPSSA